MKLTIRRKSIIIISIAIVLILAIAVGTVSYAWFVQGLLSDKFKFTVAYVETKVTLYRGQDNNRDGVLERDGAGESIFEELGDSLSGEIMRDADGNPLLDADGKYIYDQSARVSLDVMDIMPSQVSTYKIQIQNTGDVRGTVKAEITIHLDEFGKGIDVLSAKMNNKDKQYFGNCYETDIIGVKKQVVKIIDNLELDFSKGDKVNPESIGIYEIRIEFETLKDLIAAGIMITEQEYNDYMLRVYSNINLYVSIEDTTQK